MLCPKISKGLSSSFHLQSSTQKKGLISKKRNLNMLRCEFKEIPSSSIFMQNCLPFSLYGVFVLDYKYEKIKDIYVMEKNGMLFSDLSFLTKFKEIRTIEVAKCSNYQLVQISLEHKNNVQLTSWRMIVQILESSEIRSLKGWALIIKNYCTNHEDFMKNQEIRASKDIKIEEEEEEDRDHPRSAKASENKKCHLLSLFPCILLKTQYEKESGIQLREVSFNSQLLQELGYSQESFVTTVFQEGIPHFLSQNVEAASETLKMLLDNYFKLPQGGLTTEEYSHLLFMKSNFNKKASVQTHFFESYQEGNFGIDIVIVIKPTSSKIVLNYQIVPKKAFERRYLEQQRQQERMQAEFLSLYYNTSFDLRFTHINKICKIKELPETREEYFYYEKKDKL